MTKRKQTEMLAVSEAARRFGYTRTWVQKLLIKGELPGTKNRFGHWRVSVEAMETLAAARQEREVEQNRRKRQEREGGS